MAFIPAIYQKGLNVVSLSATVRTVSSINIWVTTSTIGVHWTLKQERKLEGRNRNLNRMIYHLTTRPVIALALLEGLHCIA